MGCGDVQTIDVLCHFAAALEAVAFFQSNMQYLRMLEVAANGLMIMYAWDTTGNMFNCKLIWSFLHMLINLVRIFIYWYHQYLDIPTEEEKKLMIRGQIFDVFSAAQFSSMKSEFKWRTYAAKSQLLKFGDTVKDLILVTSGTFGVYNRERSLVTTVKICDTGPVFVGELSYYTSAPATATVRVGPDGDLRAILFDMENLRLHTNQSTNHTLKAAALRQLTSLFAQRMARDFAKQRRTQGGKHDKRWEKLRTVGKAWQFTKHVEKELGKKSKKAIAKPGNKAECPTQHVVKEQSQRRCTLSLADLGQGDSEDSAEKYLIRNDDAPVTPTEDDNKTLGKNWFEKDVSAYDEPQESVRPHNDSKIYPSPVMTRGGESKERPPDEAAEKKCLGPPTFKHRQLHLAEHDLAEQTSLGASESVPIIRGGGETTNILSPRSNRTAWATD